MLPRFQRTIEDFDCGHCGAHVTGNGFTNHCPHCLWSKHVDINPGDRASDCGGLMAPIAVMQKRGGYVITFRCTLCRATHNNKSAPDDDFDVLLALARQGPPNV